MAFVRGTSGGAVDGRADARTLGAEGSSLRPDTESEPSSELMEVAAMESQLARGGGPIAVVSFYRI